MEMAQDLPGMGSQPEGVPGKAEFTADYNGSTFAFSTAENRDKFTADPAKYAPQFDGHCAYGVSKGGKVPGNPNLWRIVDGKLYLNITQNVVGFWEEDIPGNIDLAENIDVILMRQDPPFDLGYISAALLLDRLKGKTLVSNDPREVINAPEKMLVLDYHRFMPPTLIARRAEDVRGFQKKHGAIVVKPLHGNGGKAIFKIDESGTNLSALLEMFDNTWPEPHMVQAFLPSVSKGDKRIVTVDGEVAGAINRKPGEGEFRSNLAQGGYAEAATLTTRER